MAANENGPDYACIQLGTIFAYGRYNFPVDTAQAIRLLKLGVSGTCSQNTASNGVLRDGERLLQDLLSGRNTYRP